MRGTVSENWREIFLGKIQDPSTAEALKVASLSEDLLKWTASLTEAVVKSCQEINWTTAAKGFPSKSLPQMGQEYLSLDVMAFPTNLKTARWPMPTAVFELENHRSDQRVAYSLWKVLCVRAELRVVFAFRRTWEAGRTTVDTVCKDVIGGLSPMDREALSGETILAIGNRGEGETFPWGYFKFWKLDPNLGHFEKV